MIESRCGILCTECSCNDGEQCKGCLRIKAPFWAEACPVKQCCEGKKQEHCGECEAFPCDLLKSFAYHEEQGDDGKRIRQCAVWAEESA